MSPSPDPPWHTLRVKPHRLVECIDLLELVRTMGDAVTALRGYCEAGVIHGRLSSETIMIFFAPGGERTFGVVLDLDGPQSTRYVPGGVPDTSGYRWTARYGGDAAPSDDTLKMGGDVSRL